MAVRMWAYLWDIAAVGVEQALDEMQAVGVDTVSVATSYHAGRFVAPRIVPPLYYPEDGTVHVPVETGPIGPSLSHFGRTHSGLLPQLLASATARGMAVSSWTVLLHNARIGLEHPELTVKNAWGGPLVYSLCPSQPLVRDYATRLCRDLVQRYGLSQIELESVGFMGLVHEFPHEKDGVGLTPPEQLLMSLCFCPACENGASRSGVDVGAARHFVRQELTQALSRETPAEPVSWAQLAQVPALAPYWSWRVQSVHRLLREIKNAVPESTRVWAIESYQPQLAPFYGVDYDRLPHDVDGILFCLYDRDAETVSHDVGDIRGRLGPDAVLGAGFRLFYPEMRNEADFVAKIRACRQAGIGTVSLYNYGMVPTARLSWVGGLTDRTS